VSRNKRVDEFVDYKEPEDRCQNPYSNKLNFIPFFYLKNGSQIHNAFFVEKIENKKRIDKIGKKGHRTNLNPMCFCPKDNRNVIQV
jgi:hypothetical protein